MKIKFNTAWNWWKVIRLLFAFFFIVGGILSADDVLILAGLFLLAHVFLANCSACYGVNCEVTPPVKP